MKHILIKVALLFVAWQIVGRLTSAGVIDYPTALVLLLISVALTIGTYLLRAFVVALFL